MSGVCVCVCVCVCVSFPKQQLFGLRLWTFREVYGSTCHTGLPLAAFSLSPTAAFMCFVISFPKRGAHVGWNN